MKGAVVYIDAFLYFRFCSDLFGLSNLTFLLPGDSWSFSIGIADTFLFEMPKFESISISLKVGIPFFFFLFELLFFCTSYRDIFFRLNNLWCRLSTLKNFVGWVLVLFRRSDKVVSWSDYLEESSEKELNSIHIKIRRIKYDNSEENKKPIHALTLWP